MRTRFDQFGKQMARVALARRGVVETDAEVTADTRRIDVWFTPDRGQGDISDDLGLFGRITAGPSTLEFFHCTPAPREMEACLIKHGQFRHVLSLRTLPPPTPMQWIISSGRPEASIVGLCFHPMWPSGIYEGPRMLWTRLVVVSELPVERETLLLRLLGAGRVLKQAIAELKALQHEEPERALALPILLRLRLDIPSDPVKQTSDDQEFLMDTQDIVETWRQEAIQEGVEQGIEQGIERGIERGMMLSLIDIYEARFGTVPAELRSIVEGTHDEPTLRAWLKLAGTRGADELTAAIRAARVS